MRVSGLSWSFQRLLSASSDRIVYISTMGLTMTSHWKAHCVLSTATTKQQSSLISWPRARLLCTLLLMAQIVLRLGEFSKLRISFGFSPCVPTNQCQARLDWGGNGSNRLKRENANNHLLHTPQSDFGSCWSASEANIPVLKLINTFNHFFNTCSVMQFRAY